MKRTSNDLDRRRFLKYGALAGVGALAGTAWPGSSWSASKERLTILSSIALDNLHPYAYSSGPQYGIWYNMIEPLVDVDFAKRSYFGVLAESWEFQGKKWIFKLRKNVRFHDGSRFTAADVIYSFNRVKNDKLSLQKENFRDLVEMQALDDHTLVVCHRSAQRGVSRPARESFHHQQKRHRSARRRARRAQAGGHRTLSIRQLAARR